MLDEALKILNQTGLITLIHSNEAEKNSDKNTQFVACAEAFETIAAELSGETSAALSSVLSLPSVKKKVKVLKDKGITSTIFREAVTKSYLAEFPDSKDIWAKFGFQLWSPAITNLDFKTAAQLIRARLPYDFRSSIQLMETLCKNPKIDKSQLSTLFVEVIEKLYEGKVSRKEDCDFLNEVIDKNKSQFDPFIFSTGLLNSKNCPFSEVVRLVRYFAAKAKWTPKDLDESKEFYHNFFVGVMEKINIFPQTIPSVLAMRSSLQDVLQLPFEDRWDKNIDPVLLMRSDEAKIDNVVRDGFTGVLFIDPDEEKKFGDRDAAKIVYYLIDQLGIQDNGVLKRLDKSDLNIVHHAIAYFIFHRKSYSDKETLKHIDQMDELLEAESNVVHEESVNHIYQKMSEQHAAKVMQRRIKKQSESHPYEALMLAKKIQEKILDRYQTLQFLAPEDPLMVIQQLIDEVATPLKETYWQRPFLNVLEKVLLSKHLDNETLDLVGTLFERDDLQALFKGNTEWKRLFFSYEELLLAQTKTLASEDPLKAIQQLIDEVATPLKEGYWQRPFLKVLGKILLSEHLDNETLNLVGTLFERDDLQALFKGDTEWKLLLFSTIIKKIKERAPDALPFIKKHWENSPLDASEWLAKLEENNEKFPIEYLQPFYDIFINKAYELQLRRSPDAALNLLLRHPALNNRIQENPSLQPLLAERIERRLSGQTKDAKNYLSKYWKSTSYSFQDWLEKLRTLSVEKQFPNSRIIPFYEALIKSAPDESVSHLIHLSEVNPLPAGSFFQLMTLVLRIHHQDKQVVKAVGEIFEHPDVRAKLSHEGRWKGLLLHVIDAKLSNAMPNGLNYFAEHYQETPYSYQEWSDYFAEKSKEGLATVNYLEALSLAYPMESLESIASKMFLSLSDAKTKIKPLEEDDKIKILEELQAFLVLHEKNSKIIDRIGEFFDDSKWIVDFGYRTKSEQICQSVIQKKILHSSPDALDYFKNHLKHIPHILEEDWSDFLQELKTTAVVKKENVEAFEAALKDSYLSKEPIGQDLILCPSDSFGSSIDRSDTDSALSGFDSPHHTGFSDSEGEDLGSLSNQT